MINEYYIMENGQQVGPYSHHELMEKGISTYELVLSPLGNGWQSAVDLPEFAEYFASQGVFIPVTEVLASFWWRLLAWAIDYVILIVFFGLAGGVSGLIIGLGHLQIDTDSRDADTIWKVFAFCAFIIYNAVFEASHLRGSPGKKICKLMVVNINGEGVSFGTALGRNAAKIISSLLCGLGFLTILWDNSRQGWHDKMANTYVIRQRF